MNERRLSAIKFFKLHCPEYAQEAEDFGSFCVEQWLKGRDLRTLYKYLASDFIRYNVRRSKNRGSSDALCSLIDDVENIDIKLDHIASKRLELGSLIRKRDLTKEERAILILAFEWELETTEIADCFGYSKGRVSQLKKRALLKVKP